MSLLTAPYILIIYSATQSWQPFTFPDKFPDETACNLRAALVEVDNNNVRARCYQLWDIKKE